MLHDEPATAAARLLLIRHPETDWNSQNRWQGHADPPLNARGRQQMREAWATLPPERWVAVYSSDLLRALEMASSLACRLGVAPRVTERLRERAMGEWDGLTPEEARARWPELYRRVEAHPFRGRPPGGESFADLLSRVAPVLSGIAARHAGEAALVVTHGGILKALLCTLLEVDFAERETLGVTNAFHVLFEMDGRRWTILKPEGLARRQSSHDPHEALR